MKNYIRDEDRARASYVAMPAPMESGLINYREAFHIALSVGFQGILCTEHYGGDGLSVTATNQDYLRRQVLPKRDGYALGTSQVAQGPPELRRCRRRSQLTLNSHPIPHADPKRNHDADIR